MAVFSVIIPLFNKEQHIGTTLSSALNQTFTDFEIIIIDDGSTDNSGKVISTFTDERLRYIKTENRGVSAARNKGITESSAKLITFLDADDLWEPNHLAVLYDLYKKYPEAGMFCSRYKTRIGNNVLLKPDFIGIKDDFEGLVPDPFYSSLVNRIAQTSSLAIPKNVLKTVGLFNENVTHPEDTELWIKILIKYPLALSSAYTMTYNFDLPESWSRKKMANRKVMDFNQFLDEEQKNKTLKAFIDIYRVEYALKYRIEGNLGNSVKLFKAVLPENINYKTKLLFKIPPFILRVMLNIKHKLHKNGISFSVYH